MKTSTRDMQTLGARASRPHPVIILGSLLFSCLPVLADATNTSTTATNAAPTVSAVAPREPGPNELRLNFRGAPIELVLNYLSDAAGFIIQLNTPVHGKLDVWSNQPVTKEEAVDLLNSVLNHNGYAAVQNGRLLTVMSHEDALHADIPVRVSDDPDTIPKNDEIVTLIIPVRFVEAEQLVKDLSPLVSSHATILANEAANSIVVTDTQANIRHLAEIVKAIDTSAEDVTELHVYHLKHHDPQEIATLLNGLYSDQASTTGAQAPFRFGGFFGSGRGGGATPAAPAVNPQSDRIKKRARVVAVADPRTSSVVVSASKDMTDQIAGMIEQLDQESPKVAHVSVIHLENSDPQQIQQVLQDMFQSSTSTRNSSTQVSPLQTRIQQNNSTTTSSSTGLGGNGVGTSRSGTGVPSF
jgi:general secretion pathway protein D